MAREPNDRPTGRWDASPNAAEAWILIDALLENRISDADRKRLEQRVIEEPAIAQLYLRIVHFWCSLPLHVGEIPAIGAMLDDFEPDEQSENAMSNTLIMPAITDVSGIDTGFGGDLSQAIDAPPKLPAPSGLKASTAQYILRSKTLRRGGLAAAVLIALGGVIFGLWPQPSPAIVTATAAATFDGSKTSPGTRLSKGQAISLTDGAIEITFNSGATAVVAAPARFHIVDRNTLALDSGLIAAHVPISAIGFKVATQSLSVIDRGTNFGVRTTNADTIAEVDVFDGKVDATASDSAGNDLGSQLRVIAHQAVASTTSSASTLVTTAYVPDAFPRDISAIRMSLGWHGTGAGVSPGSADSKWTITSVSGNPDWTPQAATVVQTLPAHYPGNLPDGQWISTSAAPGDALEGDYVYQTSVDLNGYDQSTADVTASVAVDQGIVDIYINGVHAFGTSTLTDDLNAPVVPVQVPLPAKFWQKGMNAVQVVVKNLPEHMPQGGYGGLQLVWKATACPIVLR